MAVAVPASSTMKKMRLRVSAAIANNGATIRQARKSERVRGRSEFVRR
ncbi:MAG: hypothetical protein ACI9UA_002307 [Pseudoalteromonas tetraodonis]|jgi:hypothetical protein